MKKSILAITTLALSLLMATTVFAKPSTNYKYTMMGNYASTKLDNDDYNTMNEFMEKNFGYSMMNRNNSVIGMTQEQFDDMNKFMDENFGYTMADVDGRNCNMTQEQFDAMNKYMKENFGYAMNSKTNSGSRRSCHN